MRKEAALLELLGGEAGCQRLSAEFYARVSSDPVLRPLFPGKSLKCAIEEFAAFLIQFLGGDEGQTQRRWWLSLRESHARFRIRSAQRQAWLTNMAATLHAASFDESTRTALRRFFEYSSAYVTGNEPDRTNLGHDELATRWGEQLRLDDAIAAIAEGRDQDALALAPRFASRPAVFVGLLARMIQSGGNDLISFVADHVKRDPSVATRRSAGRTLLHSASGAGGIEVVASLLKLGTDPEIRNSGGHTPLYCVANECAGETGPEIVKILARAGAARRGHVEIARALLDSGASSSVQDRKGDTPLRRAIKCQKPKIVELLVEYGAAG